MVLGITENIAKESILSIQFALDGLSFAIRHNDAILRTEHHKLNGQKVDSETVEKILGSSPALSLPYGEVRIIVDNDRICWVPAEFFDRSQAKSYFKTNSIVKGSEDKTVVCRNVPDMVGLTLIPKDIYRFFKERYEKVTYSHPLALNLLHWTNHPGIVLNFTESFVHVTVRYQDCLLFADTFPYRTIADVFYYLHVINKDIAKENSSIVVAGVMAQKKAKELSEYYKSVEHEEKSVTTLPNANNHTDAGSLINIIGIP